MSAAIVCHGIGKTYGEGELAETVLHSVDLQIHAGEACILLGPSGSGKTTLLSILGCLLTPTKGRLELSEQSVHFERMGELTKLRRQRLGFVFQHAQLLPFLTVLQNVALIAENTGLSKADAKQHAMGLLTRLGMESFVQKKPAQLSGGQRQRVAIGRALVHKPSIVLADEPTAALDWHYGQTVVDLLIEQTRELNAALVVVSHDLRLVPRFDRVFAVDNGQVIEKPEHD